MSSGLLWQQQVRVGVSGFLDHVQITSGGANGSTITIKVRSGATWSTGPVLAERTVRKAAGGFECHVLDFSEAAIYMTAGSVFVLDISGTGSDCGVIGSYANPSTSPGGALYSQPLYFMGSRFLNNGWRIGFATYVSPRSPCVSDFNGDGGVDGEDLAAFLEAWESGLAGADVSFDGGIDGEDVLEFLVAWEQASC